MKLNKLILFFLLIFLFSNSMTYCANILSSIDYIVFSDSIGLWSQRINDTPMSLYELPPSWEITAISINKHLNEIVFTEVYKSKNWMFSNVRSVPMDKSYNIQTIGSTAGKINPGSYSVFRHHFSSPDGNYLVIQRDCWECSYFQLYKRKNNYWISIDVPKKSDFQRYIGWSKDSKNIYFVRGEMDEIEGMFRLDIDALEPEFMNKYNAISFSTVNNMFLTLPYSFGFTDSYQIEIREIGSAKLIKSIDHIFKGRPIWDQIRWHPSLPIVIVPQKSTYTYGPKNIFVSTFSITDTLNQNISLPITKLTHLEWSNFNNSFIYSFEGKLFIYSFRTNQSEKIELLNNQQNIRIFKIIWKSNYR